MTDETKTVIVDGKEFKSWMDFSARDVPEEMVHELMKLSDLGEERAWGAAKLTMLLDRGIQAEGLFVPRNKLYGAVAQHLRCSGESVRMWVGVATRMPPGIREKYGELSFHAFKAVAPHARTFDDWDDVIGRWLDYAANSGHAPGSVDGLRSWLLDAKGAPPPEVGRHRRVGKAVVRMMSDPSVPEEIRSVYNKFFDTMNYVAAGTDYIWEAAPVAEDGE